jgi:hypothetical protein
MGVITPILAKEFNKYNSIIPWNCWAKQRTCALRLQFSELNTALPNIRVEQSVCTSLDENNVTHSILLRSQNVRKGGGLIFFIFRGPCFLTIFDMTNIE